MPKTTFHWNLAWASFAHEWENSFFLLLKFTFLYHKTLHSENLEGLEAKVIFLMGTETGV